MGHFVPSGPCATINPTQIVSKMTPMWVILDLEYMLRVAQICKNDWYLIPSKPFRFLGLEEWPSAIPLDGLSAIDIRKVCQNQTPKMKPEGFHFGIVV